MIITGGAVRALVSNDESPDTDSLNNEMALLGIRANIFWRRAFKLT